MLLAWNIGRGWSSQFLGLRRRSILCLRLRKILGYLLFTRNGLLWVVAVLITHAFQPALTVISSFLFKRYERIALEGSLARCARRVPAGDNTAGAFCAST